MRLLLLAVLLAGQAAIAAPDEEALGKSQGYPVCKLRISPPLGQECLVGILSNFDTVAPARKVARGSTQYELKRGPENLRLTYWVPGEKRSGDVESFLAQNRNTGLLVLKGDTLLVERYQYERKPEHRFQSYSMAKTVVAMLLGLALAEGRISSIDDLAEKYVPVLKGHAYGQTSLRHLLTMSSGVTFTENYAPGDDISILARKTIYQEGPGGAQALLSFNHRERPAGTRFYYASAETQALSAVVRNATGKRLADYLSEKIWQPMGAEADASWLVDGGGNELGFMGLNATLRDWGRLGLLLANGGAMNGKQIIPAEWIRDATRPDAPHLRVGYATRFNGYGYQTWLVDDKGRFALLGVRGQAVFVDPETKTVVVHTAVHAGSRDPARAEQYPFFYGMIESAKKINGL